MTTHNNRNKPEYGAWRRMKTACYNKKSPQYSKFGGKGIRVCEEWVNDFGKFLDDMGPMSDMQNGLHLLDPTKDFCKFNCKWGYNESGRPRKPRGKVTRTKPKDTPYKRVLNPKAVCIVLEQDLVDFIAKQSMRKSLDEGYYISPNDMIREVLERQFARTKQRDMFSK